MRIVERFYPEIGAGGFTRVDGSVAFFTRIRSLLAPTSRVLDFGAGRGWAVVDDPLPFRRGLQTLRGSCAGVVGVDPDPVVRTNPGLDEAHVVEIGQPLPFEAESFDLIVCDHVFEHVEAPAFVAAELGRVLRPGGWICARTPNRHGYIAFGARLVPNAIHARILRRLQPERESIDVFPTRYRLNTRSALRSAFPTSRFEHFVYGINAEPTYVGRSRAAWLILWAWFRISPEALAATWLIFLRKRPAREAGGARRSRALERDSGAC